MSRTRGYLGFVATLILISGGLILIGLEPSRRLGGGEAVHGLVAACGLSFVASIAGSVPVLMSGTSPGARIVPALLSFGLRFLSVLAGAALIVWLRLVEPRPFLLWLGISYLALLVVDVRFALRGATDSEKAARTD